MDGHVSFYNKARLIWKVILHSRFRDVHEVDERCFLGARPDDLGWSHHEALGVPRLHLRILLLKKSIRQTMILSDSRIKLGNNKGPFYHILEI